MYDCYALILLKDITESHIFSPLSNRWNTKAEKWAATEFGIFFKKQKQIKEFFV